MRVVALAEIADAVDAVLDSPQNQVQAVCVDYFDTLVYRSVYPQNTKLLASCQFAVYLGRLSGRTIYELRQELEGALCAENAASGKDAEFALPELGARLFHLLRKLWENDASFPGQAEFVETFCSIELAVEKAVQELYPEMVTLLGKLRQRCIPLYLVSDFYLPSSLFKEILIDNGLSSFFSEIFVSADYGRTKGAGGLYEIVIERLGLSASQLLMIGDNPHADQAMAERAGVQSLLVDVADRKAQYLAMRREEEVCSLDPKRVREAFAAVLKRGKDIPFLEMGASLWLFVARLFSILTERRVGDVFFCSKEGEFLKQLFTLYQERFFGRQVIASHYLLVSRKSTFICSLKTLENESFDRLFAQYRDLSLKEFVLSLNFSQSDVQELRNVFPRDWEARLADIGRHEDLRALLDTPMFQVKYEQHRFTQKENFLTYLQSFNVDFATAGLHLVDVGWKGSIQNNLYFALDEKIAVQGYYVGLLSPSALSEQNHKTGVLFSDHPEHSPFIHVYNNNRSLFEMVLGASHGSADGYFTETQFQQVREQRRSTSIGGNDAAQKVVATVLDLPEERNLYETRIRPLQCEYLRIFKEMTEANRELYCRFPDFEWFAEQHARMLFFPKAAEVDFFARLYHLENFGLFEFTTFDVNGGVGFWQRLKNLRALLKNPAGYLETGVWPPIILRRLGLSWLQAVDGRKRWRRVFGEKRCC